MRSENAQHPSRPSLCVLETAKAGTLMAQTIFSELCLYLEITLLLLRSALNDINQILDSRQGNKVEKRKEFALCCGSEGNKD